MQSASGFELDGDHCPVLEDDFAVECGDRISEAHPAVIGQAVYFNMHPTGRADRNERLKAMMGKGGIADCGKAQNCVKVCPKEIPLTRSISKLNWQVTVRIFEKLFKE